MAITYKDVNVIQTLPAYYREIYTAVLDELKGADENIFVSYRTNIDDPSDVEFVVGARDVDSLHEFILKYAKILSQLSSQAEDIILKSYLHTDRSYTFAVLPAPRGAEPVNYRSLAGVCEGPERNSSWWFDCTYGRVFTKKDILDSKLDFTTHQFVKIRD